MIPTLARPCTSVPLSNNDRKPTRSSNTLCGTKRDRSSSFVENSDSIFKSGYPSGRLAPNLGDSLPPKAGLSKSPNLQSPGEFSLCSFAGIISSIKARGRTTSLGSEQTNVTSNLSKKCSYCGMKTANLSANILSPFPASPGKLLF